MDPGCHAKLLGLLGRPLLLWGHAAGRDGRLDLLRRTLARRADALLAYTAEDAAALAAEVKVPVTDLGNALFREAELRCAVACSPKAAGRDFIFVGRLSRDKNVEVLLPAFSIFQRLAGPEAERCRLLIVGDGPARDDLRSRAGVGVVVLPAIYGANELAALYADAVAAVSPGYAGLSAVQALGFGTPLILPRGAEHAPEVLACPTQALVWFPESEPNDIAQAMLMAWRDRVRLESAGRDAAAYVYSHHTIDRMAARFIRAIEQCLKGETRP